MIIRLNCSTTQLWNGCILAGIAHAIMVGEYPFMANEQSWDGLNYSVQDSCGQRGTISFRDNYCVAAFRNDNSVRMKAPMNLEKFFEGADDFIVRLAHEEALQYLLLDDRDGKVVPVITTAFWGKKELMANDTLEDLLNNGGALIENQLCDITEAVERWKETYEMNDEQINLMMSLYERKINNPDQPIKLSKKEISSIDIQSDEGMIESKASFKEMNILL